MALNFQYGVDYENDLFSKEKGAYARTSYEALSNVYFLSGLLMSPGDYWGWTANACAALFGNVEWESGYNPWRWESDIMLANTDTELIESSLVHGYGLVQFTPAGKYIYSYDDIDPDSQEFYGPSFENVTGSKYDGLAQIAYLNEWADYYKTSKYPLIFTEFKHSEASPAYLTSAWLYNYERPADPAATESKRQEAADFWYEFITGAHYKYKKSFPIWMMCRNKYKKF